MHISGMNVQSRLASILKPEVEITCISLVHGSEFGHVYLDRYIEYRLVLFKHQQSLIDCIIIYLSINWVLVSFSLLYIQEFVH